MRKKVDLGLQLDRFPCFTGLTHFTAVTSLLHKWNKVTTEKTLDVTYLSLLCHFKLGTLLVYYICVRNGMVHFNSQEMKLFIQNDFAKTKLPTMDHVIGKFNPFNTW